MEGWVDALPLLTPVANCLECGVLVVDERGDAIGRPLDLRLSHRLFFGQREERCALNH